MFEAILQKIKGYDTIILHRHHKPDGDALGSQVGLKHLLLENFPEKRVYMVGDQPGLYAFIEGAIMDDVPDSEYSNALAVILDCGGANMICDERYRLAAATVRIDHHIFTGKIADEEVIDTSFESCCGQIAQLAMESKLRLTPIAAKALYTGMVTDSGRFRYDSTSSRTHRLAAFLMEQEFDSSEIFRLLYADTYESKRLKALFVLKIQFTEHRTAYIYTIKDEVSELGADLFTISRGMVNVMADMKQVSIWVNFTETDKGVLCELRSNAHNINPIAVKYGGGGHAKASGATVPDKATAMMLLNELDAMIGETL